MLSKLANLKLSMVNMPARYNWMVGKCLQPGIDAHQPPSVKFGKKVSLLLTSWVHRETCWRLLHVVISLFIPSRFQVLEE